MKTSQVSYTPPSMEEQLLDAARDGDIKKLEYVFSHGNVNLSATDSENGGTALHLACKNTHPQIVRLLLKNGLDINAVDRIRNTPLHLAALMGSQEIVILLLKESANLTLQNNKGETAKDTATTAEIQHLIKAKIDLQQFQQEQLGIPSASLEQTVSSLMDEDKKYVKRTHPETSDKRAVPRTSSSQLSPALPSVNLDSPIATDICSSSTDEKELLNEHNVQANFVKIQTLYSKKNYFEAANVIKASLKYFDQQEDKLIYQSIEYQCFTILGDIYLERNIEQKDLQDYPKAVALYQYARRMTVLSQSSEQEAKLQWIDNKLIQIEESFVNSINCHINYKCNLSISAGYKKELEDFRLSLKPRLDKIKELGVENDELNEERLYERAKIVEVIYTDIRKFFISKEPFKINNMQYKKGLLVRLIEQAKSALGPIPYEANYDIIGLGSMALGTMTPWSDIEFAILIQDKLDKTKKRAVKDYFRKLTILLHVYIINLGETELASMAIKELNDFESEALTTPELVKKYDWFWDKLMPNGFSFESQRPIACKTPRGRSGFKNHKDYKLICTPAELAKYQDEWADREPTLQQLLLNTALIESEDRSGEENIGTSVNSSNRLLNAYHQLIKEKSAQKEKNELSRIQSHSLTFLLEAMEKYAPFKTIKDEDGKLFDTKKDIYRYLDRILVAISNYFGIWQSSQWDTLKEMNVKNIIDKKTERTLIIALSIACELRLTTYVNNMGQHGQFSVFHSSHINPIENMQTDSSNHSKLTNIGILKAFFYITTTLESRISDYLSKTQFINQAFTPENNLNALTITEISLDRTANFIKGLVSIRLMDYNQATKYLETAKDELEKEVTKQEANIAKTLNALGKVYQKLGKYQQAIKYYEQALKIQESVFGKDHPDYTNTINNLANVYVGLGRYAFAMDYYNQALAIRKEVFDSESIHVAETLNGLGKTHGNTGNFPEACMYCSQALTIRKKILGKKHPLVAETLNNLGNIYKDNKDYKQAVPYFEQSLIIFEATFGKAHPSYVATFNSLADTRLNREESNLK